MKMRNCIAAAALAAAAAACGYPAPAAATTTLPSTGGELQWHFQIRNTTADHADVPPRFFHAMASAGDVGAGAGAAVVMFGGLTVNVSDGDLPDPAGAATVYGDTWVWQSDLSATGALHSDDGRWMQVPAPSSHPSPRFAHAMANLAPGTVMLFGGQTNTSTASDINGPVSVLQDVWIFNVSTSRDVGGSWEPLPRSGAFDGGRAWPSARSYASLSPCGDPFAASAGNGVRRRVLMFGGRGAHRTALMEETWVFEMWRDDGGAFQYQWVHKTGAAAEKHPTARWGHAMAPMGVQDVVMFGGHGSGSALLNDTWIFQCPTSEPDQHPDPERHNLSWTEVELDIRVDLTSFLTSVEAPGGRGHHSMAKAAGETVLMFGGGGNEHYDYTKRFQDDSTWFFTKATADGKVSTRYKWRRLTGMGAYGPARRYGTVLTTLERGTDVDLNRPDDVLLFGGRVQRNTTRMTETEDGADTW